MTRKRKCYSKSNSFVAAAEQVCLQPVLDHRQRRGRRNIAWQAIPHLCCSNRKGTTSDSWPTTGRNVKLISGGGPEPASVSVTKRGWWRIESYNSDFDSSCESIRIDFLSQLPSCIVDMLAATAAVLALTSSAFLACTSWVRRIRARFCYRTTTRGTNQR